MTRQQRVDWTGRILRLRVDGPAHGGEFVARHEGRVVFCRGGITDELVEVSIDDDPGRGFCRGSVLEVLEPSTERRAPHCPAAEAGAGCCDWTHIRSDAARRFAGTVLAEQAARIGRIDGLGGAVAVEPPAGDDTSDGWRTVARWVTDPQGVPGVRRARSGQLITQPCVQPDPRILEAVSAAGVGPGREVLGILGDDGAVHVSHRRLADPRDRRGGQGSRRAATRARARHARAGAWTTAVGPSTVVRRVGRRSWDLPVGAFWQAHRGAAEHYSELVRAAVRQAPGLPSDPVVWDLYGGAGMFAAASLDAVPAAGVTLVESSTGAVDAASGALAGEPGVTSVRSRVETFLDRPVGDTPGDAPDVVILDPPRGGAGVEVMSRLADRTRSRIVHVGCDAASLARDVGVLVAAGWTLVDLHGVAAFPGTHHVEGVAVLDSPPTDRSRRFSP